MMELASDVGDVPMQVAAVLRLDTAGGFDAQEATRLVVERVTRIPRLGQLLVQAPIGCGRPVWIDDPSFDASEHISVTPCPSPGDEAALLELAVAILGHRFAPARPMWTAVFVTDLADGDTALVVAFHHVLADGIGGLAVLAELVDGAPAPVAVVDAYRPATPPELFRDAWRARLQSIGRLPSAWCHVRDAMAELRPDADARGATCSLNQPTGARRHHDVVRTDLEDVHAMAHARGATVNDIVLTAVAGALGSVLRSRGEAVDTLVISVPVSARQQADVAQLGNQAGVMPVALPTSGDPSARLAVVAEVTREHKTAARGASATVVAPMIRLVAWMGGLRWFINRQHMINTLVTNLHGPDERLSLAGATIRDVVAISGTTGNVTVDFAVLSYAGTLAITITTDPDAFTRDERALLSHELEAEIHALTGPVGPRSAAGADHRRGVPSS